MSEKYKSRQNKTTKIEWMMSGTIIEAGGKFLAIKI